MDDIASLDLTDQGFYRFFAHDQVRFSDTDLVGHVNNVAHVALVETGRIAYATSLAERAGVTFGTVTFVHLSIDFRDDLYYPAKVRVGARVVAVGTTSFTVGVGVFDGDRCVSTSTNVLVTLGDDRRPQPLPAAFRAVLEEQLPDRGSA